MSFETKNTHWPVACDSTAFTLPLYSRFSEKENILVLACLRLVSTYSERTAPESGEQSSIKMSSKLPAALRNMDSKLARVVAALPYAAVAIETSSSSTKGSIDIAGEMLEFGVATVWFANANSLSLGFAD